MSAKSVMAVVLGLFPMYSHAATRFVATTGVNSGACTSQASPCRTIPYGASQMVAGDTLIVADGTYSEINPIYDAVPSGNAGPDGIPRTADDVYTTVRAANDFGVLIDGSAWTGYAFGIRLREKQFIQVRGFRVHLSQGNENGAPVSIENSNHIKIIRNGFGYAGVTGNSSTVAVGVDSDYVLVEENFAFGGSRYMFLNYWADHVVFRRNVARNDYWIGTLQAAAFTNYDSVNTVWQNNIAIDSNTGCCPGHSGLYAAFFNENKSDRAPDTSQEFHGNIVLNFKAGYGTHLDWLVTGTRKMSNNIWWDGNGAYWGAQGETEIQGFPSQNLPASWPQVSHITSGENAGVYDPANAGGMWGTGLALNEDWPNEVKSSIFVANESFGVAGYVNGHHNAFFGNGAPYGGAQSDPGVGDITNHNILYSVANPGGSLRYLPRGPEPGSLLASAGDNGGRVGARVLWKIGLDGTLYGEPGWNVERSPENGYGRPEDSLWPWPNENIIKAEFAAYSGGGLPGARGFAAPGNGLYGGPITLSSYIWEYLGSPYPIDVIFRNGFDPGG
jgi:hypothetical protein